jgi:hypothetical protein
LYLCIYRNTNKLNLKISDENSKLCKWLIIASKTTCLSFLSFSDAYLKALPSLLTASKMNFLSSFSLSDAHSKE